jgi:phosphotriesterase-related protein
VIGLVRTALGDVEPDQLGRTDYHEHLFQVSPLLPGEELDDEDASREEARLLRTAGIAAMIDATPIALGRNPEAAARISAAVDLAVVLTTGAHREAQYPEEHWLRQCSAERLTARFVEELQRGMAAHDGPADGPVARSLDGQPIRAGVLKAGIGYWSISAFEHRVLEAVAAAHVATGAPVMVHLEHGSAALEVVELLARLEVSADRVVLAHIDRNPDPGLHTEIAECGAYLGYDGMARTREWPDSVIVDCIDRVAAAGRADRILVGGDVARRSRYIAYGGMPGLAYLPTRFLPRLERIDRDNLVDLVLEQNPARLLGWGR